MSQLSAIAGVPVADDAARHDMAIGMGVAVEVTKEKYASTYAGLPTKASAGANDSFARHDRSKNNSFVLHKPNQLSRGSFAAVQSVLDITDSN